jgi:hypothetical protein
LQILKERDDSEDLGVDGSFIKMDLRIMELEGADWIMWCRIETGGRLL